MSEDEILQELGLSPAEVRIFLGLIRNGSMNISEISKKTSIHRRNVYDATNRLMSKGLVFQVLSSRESIYEAAPPSKLVEIQEERERKLKSIIPALEKERERKSSKEEVYILKGVEGYRNYLRQVVKVKKPLFLLGAKGLPSDRKLAPFVQQYKQDLKKLRIKVQRLFDYDAVQKDPSLAAKNKNHRVLPDGASSPATVAIFGSYVVKFSGINRKLIEPDATIFVNVNHEMAEGFRAWFKVLWDNCKA